MCEKFLLDSLIKQFAAFSEGAKAIKNWKSMLFEKTDDDWCLELIMKWILWMVRPPVE